MEHLKEHRANLLNAFTKEYSQLERALRADLAKQRVADFKERGILRREINDLRKAADRTRELEEQNAKLQEDLRWAISRIFPPGEPLPTTPTVEAAPDGPVPHNVKRKHSPDGENASLREEYEKLKTKYKDLRSKHKHTVENFQGWKVYWEKHGNTSSDIIDQLNQDPPGTVSPSAYIKTEEGRGDEILQATNIEQFIEDALPDHHSSNKEGSREVDADNEEPTDVPTSSDSTCVDSNATQVSFGGRQGSPAVKSEGSHTSLELSKRQPSDDEPTIFAERPVKRRRRDQAASADPPEQRSRDRRGSFSKPIEVKDERLSSSPPQLSIVPNHDSLDLDEVGMNLATPRKQRAESSPGSIPIVRLSQVLGAKASPLHASTLAPVQSDPVGDAEGQGATASTTADVREPPEMNRSSRSKPAILQPKSVNARWPPRTSGTEKRKSKSHNSGADHIQVLAEDGDDGTINQTEQTSSIPVQQQQGTKDVSPAELGPLHNLLDNSPKRKTTLVGVQSRKTSGTPATLNREALTLANPRGGSAGAQRLRPASSVQRSVSNLERQAPSHHDEASHNAGGTPCPLHSKMTPTPKPLRTLPNEELTPENFKVNPHYNSGIDYAFSEVVRGHDDRRRLPGCIGAACCGGAIRKIVELGDMPAAQARGPRWNASSLKKPEEVDHDLLREFLGSSRIHEVDHMSESGKRELLIQARTKQFADRHGRHRHRYERKRTPPGFWRTDMPSTQELEQDQVRAKEMEREVVDDRRREAMREGGRWIFRDE